MIVFLTVYLCHLPGFQRLYYQDFSDQIAQAIDRTYDTQ